MQKHSKNLGTGTDSEKMEWLRQNLDLLRIPGILALLKHLTQQPSRPATAPATTRMTVPLEHVWGEFYRLVKSHMKTPRGGATGGGSMQTMFEVPMVTTSAASEMFGAWPVKPEVSEPCWELTTMELCETHLAFQDSTWSKAWGWGNGRPLAVGGGRPHPACCWQPHLSRCDCDAPRTASRSSR